MFSLNKCNFHFLYHIHAGTTIKKINNKNKTHPIHNMVQRRGGRHAITSRYDQDLSTIHEAQH